MVKYKIGFTIPAETLFGMVAKFLPIEDLHVEEIMERPEIKHSAVAKLIAEPKKSNKTYTHYKHPSGKTLKQFVIEFLEIHPSKEYTWAQLSDYAVSLGFHKSSINNAVARLLEDKSIKKTGPGKYKIVEKKTT